MIPLLYFAALASPSLARIQDDARLSKHISLRDEIISLADLTAELSKKIGVPLIVKHRVADRKVTIVFKDRPAREAMDRLAECMLMSWQKEGTGYQLDLTGQEAADEARTESLERTLAREGLRDAFREIARLSNLDPDIRNKETAKIDNEFRKALNSGEPADSPHMQLLASASSALHSAGFIEEVGPAVASAKFDEEGVPIGNLWLCSGDSADKVGHLDVSSIPMGPRAEPGGLSDGLGIVEYDEESHEIQTKVLIVTGNDGTGRTGQPGWAIPTSNSKEQSPLLRAMTKWSRPVSTEIAATHLVDSTSSASSDFCSGMLGRAQHLVDLADRSGIPVVADAFRRSLTKAEWLPGRSVQQWLASYAKACSTPYRGKPDSVREESGWLMFRQDHWWWRLKAEIPESILRPLEEKSKDHSTLPLNDYLQLLPRLSLSQVKGLEHPENVLLRFPIGSFGESYYSLAFFAGLDSAGRDQALSHQGAALSSSSEQAQALAYDFLLRISIRGSDMKFIRTVLQGGPGLLKNFRLFAEDELNHETNAAKIGNGKDINFSFTYMPTFQNTLSQQSFRCSKGSP